MNRFYTPAEVADLLHVSQSTVLRLIRAGSLPALRVSERIYRIPVPAFERFQSGPQDRAFSVAVRTVPQLEQIAEGERLPDRQPVAAGS